MTTKTFTAFFCLALFVRLASPSSAAPLTAATAVHSQPDAGSPTIASLKAGAEPVADSSSPAPSGWMAVELPGPLQGYVASGDLMKNMDIKPGAPVRLQPNTDAPVLTNAAPGDAIEIDGLVGSKWNRVKVEKKVVGYIQTSGASAPVANSTPAASAPNTAGPAPTPTSIPPASAANFQGRAVETGSGGEALPRMFEGKFVSTRRPFAPKRPYDYQLNDSSGAKLAYLDISKLLQNEQIDKYVDTTVLVYGTVQNSAEAKSLVISVESLQLK